MATHEGKCDFVDSFESVVSVNVKKSFSDYKNILLGGILLVAIVISGGLFYFLSKKGNKENVKH